MPISTGPGSCMKLSFTSYGSAASPWWGPARSFGSATKLVSMDSTSIDLCASLFDWSRYKRTKGAAKLHLPLDHNGYLPSFACITDGKTSDIEVARQFQFAPGTVVVMDRAYVDYDWWERLTQQGVFFVTRFKSDLKHEVVEERTVPQNRNIRAD